MTRFDKIGLARILLDVCLWTVLGLALPARSQDKPLERSFTAGDSARYRIQLSVRSEVQGQQTETIGAKAYVRPFARAAEQSLRWIATRTVIALGEDGTAEIEEAMNNFELVAPSPPRADEETAKLATALSEALAQWGIARTLNYRETKAGQLLELKPDGAPALGEAAPPLLMLWLLRALRPAVTLPANPVRFGESWQEPRGAQLRNWDDVRGSENGEWLEAREVAVPAVRLHIAQQLSGTVASGPEKSPEGTAQGRFHGESVNTISLSDGLLLAATRSGMREVTWTLAPVEGLLGRPQFVGRLALQIEIQACNEDPCLPPQPPAERNR